MKLVVTTDVPCAPERLFAEVDDLSDYPRWMGIVHAVESVGDACWMVELRARVGPFARSKRLRMRRTDLEVPSMVRFERQEDDGRRHGAWVLEAVVSRVEAGSRLEMTLEYSGRLWSSVVERVLQEEIALAKARLRELLT